MLKRKMLDKLIAWKQKAGGREALLIEGARRVGKSTIVEEFGRTQYKSYILIDFTRLPRDVRDIFENQRDDFDTFFMLLSAYYRKRLYERESLIIFDEVQRYPAARELIKYLVADGRYDYVETGSLISIKRNVANIVIPSEERKMDMGPLDFEEFCWAMGEELLAETIRKSFERLVPLPDALHKRAMRLWREYLLVGGMPDAVNAYVQDKNIRSVREIQSEIHEYYAADASKYEADRRLTIRRIYDMIPSNMENKKKRIVVQNIENKRGKTFRDYQEEFEYLINAGVVSSVQAISNPVFPLIESAGKNLLKLYLNDVGILTGILYGNNIRAILDDQPSVNLGSVYETVVANELKAHGYKLFYYDNRSKGEVDYLIDDYNSLSTVPIEVKSGKDYSIHSALNHFVNNEDYHIKKAFVLSNERTVQQKEKILYIPIYYIMFFHSDAG